jgi:hypothetical protein
VARALGQPDETLVFAWAIRKSTCKTIAVLFSGEIRQPQLKVLRFGTGQQ